MNPNTLSTFPILHTTHPRLYRPADDPDYRFAQPGDPVRQRILGNILADCEIYARQKPWKKIPEKPDSPHPYHQLYLTFYTGMHATALMEHYAFAWRLTGEKRWLTRAKAWMNAAASYEHSDRVEEHFYTANRYMQAFALSLDLLDAELDAAEKKRATDCLIQIMNRWWPDVEKNRYSKDGHHHAVVDNGHFGVAALHLLGKCPDAETWLSAVIDRFRSGVMPHGCGRDGEPGDGPTFWPWENLWMLQFADALRNVTGIDLYREFPKRLIRPLTWFRYHFCPPKHIEDRLYDPPNANVLLGTQLNGCSVTLLRLAQEAGDAPLRDAALRDPRLGRLYRFGAGVKGSTAECMVAYGPYTYCYFDPAFQPKTHKTILPPSRTFTRAHYGETGLLRTGWDTDAVVACIAGYKGGGAHGFANLHIQWAGYPILRSISAEEAQPVSCGSLPCVGGQNEIAAFLGRLTCANGIDSLRVRGIRTDQEYLLLKGNDPVGLVAVRRKPRGIRLKKEKGAPFVRLNGRDYLQYPREPHFNPDAGQLRIRFRLKHAPQVPHILFNTGIGVGRMMGTRVNTFSLGFLEPGKLSFCVNSQRNTSVAVSVPADRIQAGTWCEVIARWGGFNRPGHRPFIELEINGQKMRCDDPALFGELGLDSQKLQSRTTPRTFYIKSNTVLAFGGAVQMPGTCTPCDISEIALACPARDPLHLDFSKTLGPETGSGALSFKLNPVALQDFQKTRVQLGAGQRHIEVLCAFDGQFMQETVPFAPAGLAAGSLKSFIPNAQADAARIIASTLDEVLVLAFAEKRTGAKIVSDDRGFTLQLGSEQHRFDVQKQGPQILQRTPPIPHQ